MKHLPVIRALSAFAVAAALLSATAPLQAQEVVTVPSVDLKRYVGKWYEIARFPNSFQKKCISNVTAEYRARSDGDIDVTNRCKVDGG
ncbi:lipocalin family protein, partial [Herbaspirillum sp. 3C11]